jgi:hypothetical protein
MPYIPEDHRPELNKILDHVNVAAMTPGDMNYFISMLVWRKFKVKPGYAAGNELVGILECVKQEFYRRQLAPYEDQVRVINGDLHL